MNLDKFYKSLKEGDVVRVRPDLHIFVDQHLATSVGESVLITQEMGNMSGKIVTIEYNCEDQTFNVYENEKGYYWPDTAFVPLKKEFNTLIEE